MKTRSARWYAFRRSVLKKVTPEWIWPKYKLLDGVAFPVRGMRLNFGTKRWIANGLYEQDERRLVADIIEPGMRVVEMGGSIGILARIIAENVGPTGRIVSIEASTELHKYSATWCPVPAQLEFVSGFAFPVAHAQNIHVNGFQTDGSELDGRATWNIEPNPSNSEYWDLNRLERELRIIPELLVVDIEGGEEVLCTLPANIPSQTKHLIMEFHPHIYGEHGISEITKCLEREGFKAMATSGPCTRFSRTD